jgi:hypothetical protein
MVMRVDIHHPLSIGQAPKLAYRWGNLKAYTLSSPPFRGGVSEEVPVKWA